MTRTCRLFRLCRALLVLMALSLTQAAAHETTRSYLTLARDGAALQADFRIAFRDIEVAVWMDEDLDGSITWGEAKRRLDAVSGYILAGVSADAGGPCQLARTGAAASETGGVAYLDLTFAGTCPSASAPLSLTSHLFGEIDPDHRMFVSAPSKGITTTALLSSKSPNVLLTPGAGGWLASFLHYVRAGVEHLLGGPDHLVFLLALILPAICGPLGARKAAAGVLAAVTGFTLAHALTVTAAMTEILRPPSALIEIVIAASILITAIDNVRPFLPAPRAAVAAFFGIFHGFGFASALGALQLTGGGFVAALVGFNLGIELAQVALVLLVMPVLYLIGAGRWMLWLGSAAAGFAALWWMFLRISPLVTAAFA